MKIISACLISFSLAVCEAVGQGAVSKETAPAFPADGLPVIQVELSGFSVRRRPESGDPNANPGIQLYADGRYTAITTGGIVSTGILARAQLSRLLGFFQQERVLGLTNAVVEQAIERDTRRQDEEKKRIIVFPSSHPVRVHLLIRTASEVTEVDRRALYEETRRHPDVWELAAITNSVAKIYEVVLGKDAKR